MPVDARPPRLLVFDSGVGGLSIMADIQRLLPGCSVSYASDNAAFPYGTKSEAILIARVDRVLHQLIQHSRPDVVVVACNSASTLALPHIRAHFREPIVGVVPAIKPAAQRSHTKVIGLLATPGTVARPYTRDLIQQFAPDCTVISLGSSELVRLAEAHLRGQTPSPEQLQDLLSPMMAHPRASEMDTLVLACTHFPLLKRELQAVVGPDVALIDSGEAIARRVAYWLAELGLEGSACTSPSHQALFTADGPEVERLEPALREFGITDVQVIAVSND
ncbi:glutamate racemase [Marinimicrobium sp. C6131]|uniref:glutamate racemase n=1 Tax=Marinimicrobium sp. C6131 TaxID=3022676 RepID=UPI00223D5CAA|nr:glutamate racemase [Marinimicrobium sp. C6131]UZJ45288.1 glutamate racemase [Marinimicrobium sp. C6131]